MEGPAVTGVAYDRNTARLTVLGLPDQPGTLARLFGPLAAAHVNVDVIIQNAPREGRVNVSFTVPRNIADLAIEVTEGLRDELGFTDILADKQVAKVSVVGAGMRSQPGVALRAFDALGRAGVDVKLVTTSEIKISCVVDDRFTEAAVRVLHDAFELEKPPEERGLA